MFKDSPLFNKCKNFKSSLTSPCHSAHSFLPWPSHVTLRKKLRHKMLRDEILTIGSHEMNIRSHDESFESQCIMTSVSINDCSLGTVELFMINCKR